jgi:hypothetical protein
MGRNVGARGLEDLECRSAVALRAYVGSGGQ